MNNNKINKVNIIIFSILLIMSCEDNNPEGTFTPESSSISGTITFTNLSSLPLTGSISVSLSSNWLPQGPPKAADLITDFSNGTYAYTFENVSFDSYAAIAVSWYNPDPNYNDGCNQTIIGAYGGTYPWLEAIGMGGANPTPITTSTTDYELTGYDINADLNYAIPNPFYYCTPQCYTLGSQESCEEEGHCQWNVNVCETKN